MGKNLLALGLLLAVLAAGLVVWQQPSHPKATVTAVQSAPTTPAIPTIRGKTAPDYALPDVKGSTVNSGNFKGKVVLVNFWATWCEPCIVEIPWFIEFQKKYGPQGLEIVGISLDETGLKDVKPFVEKHNMTYTVLLGNDDIAGQFGGVRGLPTSFIIDRDGKYYSRHQGLVNHDDVEEELQSLLGGKASPAANAAAGSHGGV